MHGMVVMGWCAAGICFLFHGNEHKSAGLSV
jgi:hypothetical protein